MHVGYIYWELCYKVIAYKLMHAYVHSHVHTPQLAYTSIPTRTALQSMFNEDTYKLIQCCLVYPMLAVAI